MNVHDLLGDVPHYVGWVFVGVGVYALGTFTYLVITEPPWTLPRLRRVTALLLLAGLIVSLFTLLVGVTWLVTT